MSGVTPKVLVQGELLPSAAVGSPGQYRVPPSGGIAAVIHSITVRNTDTVNRSATIYLVRSGDSESSAAGIISTTLGPGATFPDGNLRVLGPGDYISGVGSVAGVISLRAVGFGASA